MLLAMINLGVYVIKGAIWVALLFYLAGLARIFMADGAVAGLRQARRLATIGYGVYLLHVLMGFQGFYGWSHEAAYEVMALQTYDIIKVRSGVVIYVNYLFTAVWLAELIWAWGWFSNWQQRSRWASRLIHGFLAGVLFCGMGIFSEGLVRWYSLALFGAVGVVWLRARVGRRKMIGNGGNAKSG
jgi:hypothetical protein